MLSSLKRALNDYHASGRIDAFVADVEKYINESELFGSDDDDEEVDGDLTTSHLGLNPTNTPVLINGVTFPSMMHALQWHKEPDRPKTDYANVDLRTALDMGRRAKIDISTWDRTKKQHFKKICKLVIEQHDDLRKALMLSDALIFEDCLQDPYWSAKGANHSGNVWTEIRDEFRKSHFSVAASSARKRKKN